MQTRFMRAAISAAIQAKQEGGVAIGAVLVEQASGKIIASGGSTVGLNHDPTDHAEVSCIREACRLLNTSDLTAYTLYCTLEPCLMCLGCAAWAKVPRIFFGAYRKDVDPSLFDTVSAPSDEDLAASMNLRKTASMTVHGGILENECASLLATYHEMTGGTAPAL